jgi:hypothetical protein
MLPDNRNKKGTGFTNLSRILQASRGSRLGGQVASGVKQTGQQVRSQIGQAGQQFQSKASEEAKKFGQDAAKERESAIESIAPVSGAQAINEEDKPKQDDLIGRFADWRSAEYKGPKGLEDYGSLMGKVSEAEQLGRLSRTSGGKQELLRRFVGGRDYSQGEQRLDAALLGLTGARELGEAQRSTRGLQSELAQQSGVASEQAQQLAKQAQQFGKDTLTQLTGKKEQILTDVAYGQGGKSLEQIVKETQDKEKARGDLGKEIKNFDANFRELVRTGVKTEDQRRSTFEDLLSKAKDAGYISADEVSRLFDVRSMSGEYNPEYDLIARAQAAGLNPYDTLGALTTQGSAAQNPSVGGILAAQDPTRAGQLRLLEQLAATPAQEAQFKEDQAEFKAGTLGLEKGTPALKLQVLDKEIPNFESQKETLSNSVNRELNNVVEKINSALTRERSIDLRNSFLKDIEKMKSDIEQKGYLDFNHPLMRQYKQAGLDRYNWDGLNKLAQDRKNIQNKINVAKNYKNKIEQEQASINNPYATKENK